VEAVAGWHFHRLLHESFVEVNDLRQAGKHPPATERDDGGKGRKGQGKNQNQAKASATVSIVYTGKVITQNNLSKSPRKKTL
jgi:hypothetical protein